MVPDMQININNAFKKVTKKKKKKVIKTRQNMILNNTHHTDYLNKKYFS